VRLARGRLAVQVLVPAVSGDAQGVRRRPSPDHTADFLRTRRRARETQSVSHRLSVLHSPTHRRGTDPVWVRGGPTKIWLQPIYNSWIQDVDLNLKKT